MEQTIKKHDLNEQWRMRAELDNLVRQWHEDKIIPNHELIIMEKAMQYKEKTGKEYFYSLANDAHGD